MKSTKKTFKNDVKKIFKNDIFKFIISIIVVGGAGIVGGVAFKTFFESWDIIPIGISGLSLIIHNALLSVADIPTSVIYLIFNIILFSFAFKIFGWRFIVLSLVGTATYTLAMQFGYIEALATAASEPLVYALVGGVLCGACVGIAMRFGGTTGGSDIAGTIINRYFPKIKTGFCILILNLIVLILSVITSGIQTGLYALVIAIISSISTNVVLNNAKRVVSYYIICDKDEEIANAILKKYHRGVTKIDAQGMFSKKTKKILLSVIPFEQSNEMKSLVRNIDENAFVFSYTVDETIGNGDFLKELSIFKNRVSKAKPKITNIKHKYNIAKTKKIKYPKKKTRYTLK
jgi:uncharacterized membrane-anchored protein YitT (DUF2179 family)